MMTSRSDADEQLIAVLSSFGSEGLDPMGLALALGFAEKRHIMGRIRSLTASGRVERVPGNGPQKWRVCSVDLPVKDQTQGNFYTDNYPGENPYLGGNGPHGFGGAEFRGGPPEQVYPNMPPPHQQHYPPVPPMKPPRPRGLGARGFHQRGAGPRNHMRGRGGYFINFQAPGQQGNSQYPSQQQFTGHKANNHFDPAQNQSSVNHYQTTFTDNQKPKQNKRKSTDSLKVACPGEARFISYKNTLQEFAQKQHFTVPSYNIKKKDFGYSGSVSLNGKEYQGEGIWKDRKQAEQNAAFAALKTLELIPSSSAFQPTVSSQGPSPKKAKVSFVITSHKSFLNEFCQRFHLPTPSYETIRSGTGYISTVVYNKKVYQSSSPQPTKKDAEQNAAQVVLAMLNQCPAPDGVNPSTLIGSGEETNIPSGTDAASAPAALTEVKPEVSAPLAPCPVSCKNQLQEYCQKKKVPLPSYETIRGSGGLFVSTVTLQGRAFQGNPAKIKKAAEQSAAEVALKGISGGQTSAPQEAEVNNTVWG